MPSLNAARLIGLLVLLLSLSACAGISARGRVGSQTLVSRVDSEVARYYLANYLAGERSDENLDARIDGVYRNANGSLPDRNQLKHLSDEFSVDFAALYLADQIERIPVNRRLRQDFDQAYRYALEAYPDGGVVLPRTAQDYEVLVVPTYLYDRLLAAGADMAAPRKALRNVGLPVFFVETDDDGAVEANADLVAKAIRDRAQSGRRLILISASKSGPEVALALTRLGDDETRHVAAWINAVGALQGTPLVDDRLLPDFELFMGKVDPAGTESMSTWRSRQRFESFRVPENILVVNYFGIPVIGSVSFWIRTSYMPLRKYGPNDGTVLLADMIFPRGVTLAELGSDHFMSGKRLDLSTVALAMTVIRWLEEPQAPDDEMVHFPAPEG